MSIVMLSARGPLSCDPSISLPAREWRHRHGAEPTRIRQWVPRGTPGARARCRGISQIRRISSGPCWWAMTLANFVIVVIAVTWLDAQVGTSHPAVLGADRGRRWVPFADDLLPQSPCSGGC